MEKQAGEFLVERILSNRTTKIKEKLLLVITISLAIIKGGLIPKSISALGIDLTVDNTRSLVILSTFICIYFLLYFIQSSISDFIRWKMNFYAAISGEFKRYGEISGEETIGRLNVPGHNDKIERFIKIIKVNNNIGIFFEIGLTIVISIISIILILVEV